MKEVLRSIYHDLVESATHPTHRYLFDTFNINSRLTGLVGQRGTGKTTLLLQYIREHIKDRTACMYASLDHIYFSRTPLFDFVDDLYRVDGVRYLFLDEVHKYPEWNRELKNLYDSFPELTVVFSGSSSLDLIKGSYDLSRRGFLYKLAGLSFREYLSFRLGKNFPPVTLQELLEAPDRAAAEPARIRGLLGHFRDYLAQGYYPFLFEDTVHFHRKLMNVINKTVNEDIPNFYRLNTDRLYSFKRIIAYLATIPPGELNRNSIARHTGLDHKTVEHYLDILHATGVACLLREKNTGSSLLKSTEKMYLDNPNLYKAVAEDTGSECNTGTVREVFFIRMLQNAGRDVYYGREVDFRVDKDYFEIGGRGKSGKQLKKSAHDPWLVKDGILYPSARTIPLYLFGFLY